MHTTVVTKKKTLQQNAVHAQSVSHWWRQSVSKSKLVDIC